MKKYWSWMLCLVFLAAGAALLWLSETSQSSPVAIPPLTGVNFIPEPTGGYSVQSLVVPPLSLGYGLTFEDRAPLKLDLPFTFPFAGQSWNEAFVSPNGLVTFGQPLDESLFQSGRQAAIVPFGVPLALEPGGVFYAEMPGQLALSWWKMRGAAPAGQIAGAGLSTFQILLVQDGTIAFRYYEPDQADGSADLAAGQPWVGLLMGRTDGSYDALDLPISQPFLSQAAGGLLDRYHREKIYRTFWSTPAYAALILAFIFLLVGTIQFFLRRHLT
jgi:hypothetical protein